MRLVARDAAVLFARFMLEHERPPLVHVALQTRLIVVVRLVQHLRGLPHPKGRGEAAVRVVTIRAVDEAFVNPMFGWQIELRTHVLMAAVTKVGLPLGQKIPIGSWMVVRMAIRAGDVVFRVF